MPDDPIEFRDPELKDALKILASSYPELVHPNGDAISLEDLIPVRGSDFTTVRELLEECKDSDEQMPPEVYDTGLKASIPETDFDGTWGCVARWLLRELQNPAKPK
jgi:hypothetical protein